MIRYLWESWWKDSVFWILRLMFCDCGGLLGLLLHSRVMTTFGEFERVFQNNSSLHHLWIYVCMHAYMYAWIERNNFPATVCLSMCQADHKWVLRRSPHRTLVECPKVRTLVGWAYTIRLIRPHHVTLLMFFFHGWCENPL